MSFIGSRGLRAVLPLIAVAATLLLGGMLAGVTSAQTPPAAAPASTATAPSAAPPVAGAVEIGRGDTGKTVRIAVGQDVTVRLGTDLDWTVSIDPPGVLIAAPGVNALVRGVQGIYRGTRPGTATVSAEGRPHCNPGQVCAQFIEQVTVTVVVEAAPGSGGAATPVPTTAAPTKPVSTTPARPAATGAAPGGPVQGVLQPTAPPPAHTGAPIVLPNTGSGQQRAHDGGRGFLVVALLLPATALMAGGLFTWRAKARRG